MQFLKLCLLVIFQECCNLLLICFCFWYVEFKNRLIIDYPNGSQIINKCSIYQNLKDDLIALPIFLMFHQVNGKWKGDPPFWETRQIMRELKTDLFPLMRPLFKHRLLILRKYLNICRYVGDFMTIFCFLLIICYALCMLFVHHCHSRLSTTRSYLLGVWVWGMLFLLTDVLWQTLQVSESILIEKDHKTLVTSSESKIEREHQKLVATSGSKIEREHQKLVAASGSKSKGNIKKWLLLLEVKSKGNITNWLPHLEVKLKGTSKTGCHALLKVISKENMKNLLLFAKMIILFVIVWSERS